MNINEAFPSKYLKADVDILPDVPVHLTITGVEIENVGSASKQETKPVLSFKETKKGLVLNKTNATTISKLYGPDTDAWTGKRITLLWKEVEFQGEMTPGIRVSLRAPAAAPASNGKPKTDRQRYDEFCAEHNITSSHITAALGTASIQEWLNSMNSMPGQTATLDNAFELILVAKQAADNEAAAIPF